MQYNFDTVVDRSNNFAAKYDEVGRKFGRDDLIPLWVADMDFKTAEPVIEAIRQRAEQGIFGYTSRPESYFEVAGQWLKKRHGWDVDPGLMIHSPGVVPSLSMLIRYFTDPGDKIIIQPPVYYPFFDVVRSNDRVLVENPLKVADGQYVMDYEHLEELARQGASMLLLCSPHNPVGRVWHKEELVRLGNICLRYGIRVIADEIHSDLIYSRHKHTPFAGIAEDFRRNTITCLAPSKTFNLAGLQASIAIFPDKKSRARFDKVLGDLDIRRNNCFSLVAVEAAYRYGEEWLEQVNRYIAANFAYIQHYCRKYIPEIRPNYPEGTYLVWVDCRGLGLDKNQLHDFMINKARLALDDGYWFGDNANGYMRINAACPRSILAAALEQLRQAVEEHIR
ncbi:Cystathionine beta-lyase PatB [Propionispora sp. 2/2-37]|uniref:MalY/PatB family protein n=1 Tax=Propionispora sp. 2/2-37 TaxID=1677858 RepID=UPI0006BB57B9|nr:PatB family C-S lyase [Propionispora sp. 2/2-37]CUH95974.1 Cystathionine beta-lyase PatB [Propionispora sp. 2/2-37]